MSRLELHRVRVVIANDEALEQKQRRAGAARSCGGRGLPEVADRFDLLGEELPASTKSIIKSFQCVNNVHRDERLRPAKTRRTEPVEQYKLFGESGSVA